MRGGRREKREERGRKKKGERREKIREEKGKKREMYLLAYVGVNNFCQWQKGTSQENKGKLNYSINQQDQNKAQGWNKDNGLSQGQG